MTPGIKPLVAGNWKMNGTRDSLHEITAMASGLDAELAEKIDALICPPATLVYLAAAAVQDTGVSIGGQDCHGAASGAHTGDLSAEMLGDLPGGHTFKINRCPAGILHPDYIVSRFNLARGGNSTQDRRLPDSGESRSIHFNPRADARKRFLIN